MLSIEQVVDEFFVNFINHPDKLRRCGLSEEHYTTSENLRYCFSTTFARVFYE